ncbi:MAG TPA: Rne/Rng family ribonuclease [Beijerinckiaceae bacterium]|jgi:ribonuclease E
MANKMLIDATHPEETRVVVVRGHKVEEFDFESASRRQLRGNIYLAKVTRVEPSLQAAFVEYGGNRHGFLAFSEIHPDYYQIPVADRQALLEEEARFERDQERDEERRRSRRSRGAARKAKSDETVSSDETAGGDAAGEEAGTAPSEEHGEDSGRAVSAEGSAEGGYEAAPEPTDVAEEAPSGDHHEEEVVEQLGGDAHEEVPERPRHHRRQYKIQEVIKRRQILLVQVVKEERGNKGAALTTYLSLAGRYSVLMPNSGRGGGISRKITSAADRKRLKEIAGDLEVPEGMGVILRTAGASRTKAEIKRDFEYLMRLWESVREATLTSSAPALVYEEGSLVKRAIRDLYNKDIDEVLVGGDESYREAKDFMRMLMPSHAKAVKPYKEPQPLFAKYGVEAQLDAMFSNQVQLRSGGYLVINPTEALVSIDVNSGRATREHNIEDTALKTNLEAAEEIARQLRLRDLAGLIVIDFIDMEEKRNNRAVEKKISDCLKNDRARIQVGRISAFGLMEMSRQRIRTGVLESSSVPCPHCAGTGFVRATASVALNILRAAEEQLIRSASHNLIIRTRTEVAFYILNQKRGHLRELEARYGVAIAIHADESLGGASVFAIDRGELVVRSEARAPVTGVRVDSIAPVDEPEVEETGPEPEEADEAEASDRAERSAEQGDREGGDGRRRRRRRRRRGRGNGEFQDREVRAGGSEGGAEDEGDEAEDADAPESVSAGDVVELSRNEAEGEPVVTARAEEREGSEAGEGRGRRRGRRGGRRREGQGERVEIGESDVDGVAAIPVDSADAAPVEPSAPAANDAPAVAVPDRIEMPIAQAKPEPEPEPAQPEPEPVAVVLTPPDPNRPKRAGWWSKAKAALGG